MQHHHHRAPLAREGGGRVHQRELVGDVEEGRGLVHQQRLRLLGEGHGQVRALALAAGELRYGHVGDVQRAGALKRALHGGVVLRAVAPGVGEIGEAAVQGHAAHADAGRGAVLRHVGALLRDLAGAEGGGGRAVQQHLAAHDLADAGGGAQQRALAAAVGPGDCQHLARAEAEADAVQHLPPAVAGAQGTKLYHTMRPFLCFSSSQMKNGPPMSESMMPTGSW